MSMMEIELSQIHETRTMIKNKYSSGKMTLAEFLDFDLKYLEASSKKQNTISQLLVSAAKHGKKISTDSERMNLINSGTAINTGSHEIDMIKCPDMDKIITRAECLDYSGSHIEDCSSCSHNKDTKRLLIDQA